MKEIIKASPRDYSAKQKLFVIKLLNKIVQQRNTELNSYIEQKLMKRLTIMAEFNNDPKQ